MVVVSSGDVLVAVVSGVLLKERRRTAGQSRLNSDDFLYAHRCAPPISARVHMSATDDRKGHIDNSYLAIEHLLLELTKTRSLDG